MRVELGILNDGGVMMVTDQPLKHEIKRIEFYREQRLFMLVYNNNMQDSDLMHYEVPEDMVYSLEKSPDVLIYALDGEKLPIGYKAPLIKVGDLY